MLQKLLKVKKPWRIGKQSLKTKTLQDEFIDQRRFKSLQFSLSHYADVEWCSFEKEQFWDGSSVFISRECLCGNVANVYAEMLRLQMGVYCKLDGAPSHKLCTNQQWKVKKEFGFFSLKNYNFWQFLSPLMPELPVSEKCSIGPLIICSSAALGDAWWPTGKLRWRRGNKQFIVSPNCTFPTSNAFIYQWGHFQKVNNVNF